MKVLISFSRNWMVRKVDLKKFQICNFAEKHPYLAIDILNLIIMLRFEINMTETIDFKLYCVLYS